MIAVTDLHDNVRYVNADMIESVEANPDTQLILFNGHRYYAKESPEEIAERVIEYRNKCGFQNASNEIASKNNEDITKEEEYRS